MCHPSLVDDDANVRSAVTRAFDVLQEGLGAKVIDQTFTDMSRMVKTRKTKIGMWGKMIPSLTSLVHSTSQMIKLGLYIVIFINKFLVCYKLIDRISGIL